MRFVPKVFELFNRLKLIKDNIPQLLSFNSRWEIEVCQKVRLIYYVQMKLALLFPSMIYVGIFSLGGVLYQYFASLATSLKNYGKTSQKPFEPPRDMIRPSPCLQQKISKPLNSIPQTFNSMQCTHPPPLSKQDKMILKLL